MEPDEPKCDIIHTELCNKLAAVMPAENQSRNAINVDNVFALNCRRFTGDRIKEIIKFLKLKLPARLKDVKINGKNKEALEMLCFAVFSELVQDIKEKRISVNDLSSSTVAPPPSVVPVRSSTVTSTTSNIQIKPNRQVLTAKFLEEDNDDDDDDDDIFNTIATIATTTTTTTAATNKTTTITTTTTTNNNKSKKQKIQHMTQGPANHRYYPVINSARKIQIFNTLKAQPGITDTEILDAFKALCTR